MVKSCFENIWKKKGTIHDPCYWFVSTECTISDLEEKEEEAVERRERGIGTYDKVDLGLAFIREPLR